jgi:hypothetical protein
MWRRNVAAAWPKNQRNGVACGMWRMASMYRGNAGDVAAWDNARHVACGNGKCSVMLATMAPLACGMAVAHQLMSACGINGGVACGMPALMA